MLVGMDELTKAVAAALRAERAALQLTQHEVAARSGLGRSTVDRALKGSGDIAVEALVALCDAMSMDVGEVLRGAVDSARDAT